ncbi:tRNA U-34 5-methylaminomethyl-2-thiouridine biosynthesis protein [Massilia sp. Root351]|uniref:FAD-dependent 5-carboxymethylaminomethyl-2-thiouridine(34) oxidoreductase MnmC n=1 Tax=Massilia sp. Root351 TaxID=1736522 RepID=UPI000709AB57|nr:FAD-dependent 5-carboxymethylaminomethyl-2-thiouridine(34) oxidoreductase MnmC [Massilia sp. Root351]KQV79426.1 tRNA U-34 5-methylaminomethyl-2-thiouridine biosynthesis protein [Massilia sp. Root351]
MKHVLLATGFGKGEHFLAARLAWRGRGALHYIALLPALPAAQDVAPELRDGWPVNVPGLHRLAFDQGRVTLDLLAGPIEATLPQIAARVDAFYLPAPIEPMRALAKLALPGATLALHGAGDVALKALRSAGFEWQPDDGQGGAPATVQAVFTSRKPQPPRAPEPLRRAVVIGAGMAGAAACERLAARGWEVTLVERHRQPAQEASGNRSGIFMPLLSRDDNIPTRLSRAAYLYAMRHWQQLGGLDANASLPPAEAGAAAPAAAAARPAIAGAQCGVLQLARDAGHAQLQKAVAAHWNYPPEFVRWVDAQEAGALLGAPTPDGGWLFSQGGWANPASICRAMLDACGARLTRVFHAEALQLVRTGDQWQVRAHGGALLAEAPHVVLANGAGALAMAHTAELPLYTMRGQVTHLQEQDFPRLPLVVCREAYLTPPVQGIVSIGATYDSDTGRALREASQQENLSRARDILPGALPQDVARHLPLAGRVGLRCMAPDRLPLVGALPDYGAALRSERLRDVPRHAGLYGLLGYASRGLIWAPLAAELLAAQLEHEALPLEASLAAALDPARFLLKSRRGGQV